MLIHGVSHPTVTAISSPSSFNRPSMSMSMCTSISMAANKANRRPTTTMTGLEARVSLLAALASQTSSLSQRFLVDLATETAKYVFPKRFESRNLEEALMLVPDLETVNFKVLSRTDQYEIREVEPYFVAETTMPGRNGFDFNGASKSFNVLAEYLFGKNTIREKMEMTTPVLTRKAQPNGEKMEMTTPVITKKVENQDKWQMSFVMPAKYGSDLPLPKDSSVKIREVPRKTVAVFAFSGFVTDAYVLLAEPGFVTDEEVTRRESKLREALKNDRQFRVKDGVSVEIAQYNPPFTLPFQRRNEIALEVEKRED